MKTHFFKRGIAGLLSLVMCLSAFIGLGTTTAFAAGEQAEVYLISFPRSGDANLDYSGTWGHSNLHYMNGWYSGESKYTTIRAMHSYDGNICYCIEPGTPQDTGDRYTSKDEAVHRSYYAVRLHGTDQYLLAFSERKRCRNTGTGDGDAGSYLGNRGR